MLYAKAVPDRPVYAQLPFESDVQLVVYPDGRIYNPTSKKFLLPSQGVNRIHQEVSIELKKIHGGERAIRKHVDYVVAWSYYMERLRRNNDSIYAIVHADRRISNNHILNLVVLRNPAELHCYMANKLRGVYNEEFMPVVSTSHDEFDWPGYLCSDSGRVFGFYYMHFLTPMLKDGRAYYKLTKTKDKHSTSKAIAAARIVAATFHPLQANPCFHVHHVNGNRIDDRPGNLLWMSPEDHFDLHRRSITRYFRSPTESLPTNEEYTRPRDKVSICQQCRMKECYCKLPDEGMCAGMTIVVITF